MFLAWRFLRIRVLHELQYRTNLVIQLFQSAIALAVGLVMLSLVFRQVPNLNGWSQPQSLIVLGVFTAVGALIRVLIKPNLDQFMGDIHRGGLDHVLAKPVDSQLLVSVRAIDIWPILDVIVGAVLIGCGVADLGSDVGLGAVLAFVIALTLGMMIIYCFLLMLVTTAFWLVKVESFTELFGGILQAGRWPIGIYPSWMRHGLTFLVPIAFAITIPAEALTSRLSGWTLLLEAGFALVLFAAARWVWRRGVRSYTGASA